jgi:hypothetical protein
MIEQCFSPKDRRPSAADLVHIPFLQMTPITSEKRISTGDKIFISTSLTSLTDVTDLWDVIFCLFVCLFAVSPEHIQAVIHVGNDASGDVVLSHKVVGTALISLKIKLNGWLFFLITPFLLNLV